MQTMVIEIKDEMKETVLSFLQTLPTDAVKIIEYDDVVFTAEDEKDYETALAEKKAGKSVSLESLKAKYGL